MSFPDGEPEFTLSDAETDEESEESDDEMESPENALALRSSQRTVDHLEDSDEDGEERVYKRLPMVDDEGTKDKLFLIIINVVFFRRGSWSSNFSTSNGERSHLRWSVFPVHSSFNIVFVGLDLNEPWMDEERAENTTALEQG